MRRLTLLLLVISAGTLSAQTNAQEGPYPKVEVFGGYSYLHDATIGVGVNSDFNGWEASLNYNLHKWLGIKADFAGHYNHSDLFLNQEHQHEFLLGPQVSWRSKKLTAFGHGLIGISHKNGEQQFMPSPIVAKLSNDSFTYVFGGGADWNLAKHISWRAAQIDYQRSRSLFQGRGLNEIRIASGIVFRLGGK